MNIAALQSAPNGYHANRGALFYRRPAPRRASFYRRFTDYESPKIPAITAFWRSFYRFTRFTSIHRFFPHFDNISTSSSTLFCSLLIFVYPRQLYPYACISPGIGDHRLCLAPPHETIGGLGDRRLAPQGGTRSPRHPALWTPYTE